MSVQCVPEDIDLPRRLNPSAAACQTKLGATGGGHARKAAGSDWVHSARKYPLMNQGKAPQPPSLTPCKGVTLDSPDSGSDPLPVPMQGREREVGI